MRWNLLADSMQTFRLVLSSLGATPSRRMKKGIFEHSLEAKDRKQTAGQAGKACGPREDGMGRGATLLLRLLRRRDCCGEGICQSAARTARLCRFTAAAAWSATCGG